MDKRVFPAEEGYPRLEDFFYRLLRVEAEYFIGKEFRIRHVSDGLKVFFSGREKLAGETNVSHRALCQT